MYDLKALYEAESVAHAIQLLQEHPEAQIIAGGSDVLVQMREGRRAGKELVSIYRIDEIRGVSSSQIVRKLLARGFIRECGKEDTIGKPNLYKTTNEFLDYFGLATKEDLPKLDIKDSPVDNSEVELYKSNYKEND